MPEKRPVQEDLRYWLALLRTPRVGCRTFLTLLDTFPTPKDLFAASAKAQGDCGLSRNTLNFLANPDWEAVDKDLAWLALPNNHILSWHDPDYPRLLKEIPDPPPLLFIHGDPAMLSSPQLAMVGCRNPTAFGNETARQFAAALANQGLTITSGLASGIDGACHQGALEVGGLSIAVTGTGLDRVYPAHHLKLSHQIASKGALVSEFVPGTAPKPSNFPRRNRLISGLSLGTLVVEATLKSGSLITARAATNQGREVFAIPGSIHNPQARGCHALIREGAKLVECVQDILEELGPLARAAVTDELQKPEKNLPEPESLDEEDNALLAQLGEEPVSVDLLVRRSGLTVESVSSMLLRLELQNEVISCPGGFYCRKPSHYSI